MEDGRIKCKGLKTWNIVMYLKNTMEVNVAGAEWAKGRLLRADVRSEIQTSVHIEPNKSLLPVVCFRNPFLF